MKLSNDACFIEHDSCVSEKVGFGIIWGQALPTVAVYIIAKKQYLLT